jgi:hypothetical protein
MIVTVGVLDTSVLCELLAIPGKAQEPKKYLNEFEERCAAGELFALPLAAIIETGNHVGQARQARRVAEKFVGFVRSALSESTEQVFVPSVPVLRTTPSANLLPVHFPQRSDATAWLEAFPEWATQRIGFGDLTICEEWRRLCSNYQAQPAARVYVWSKDNHLLALEWTTGQMLP